jgi:hypothetical protein
MNIKRKRKVKRGDLNIIEEWDELKIVINIPKVRSCVTTPNHYLSRLKADSFGAALPSSPCHNQGILEWGLDATDTKRTVKNTWARCFLYHCCLSIQL